MFDGEVSVSPPPTVQKQIAIPEGVEAATPAPAPVAVAADNKEDDAKKHRSQLRRNTAARRKNMSEEEIMGVIGTMAKVVNEI